MPSTPSLTWAFHRTCSAHLACQAEYGTACVPAPWIKPRNKRGAAEEGTLISSNPRDNYAILGTYAVPAERFQVIYPYTVERDRAAWQWSWGAYAAAPGPGPLTTGEMRKLTGKAAEMAALLVRLPLDADLFKPLEADLMEDGALSLENRRWITGILRQLPLCANQEDLRRRLGENRAWYLEQLIAVQNLDPQAATLQADATLASLLAGWHDPVLRRTAPGGKVVQETGVPLRAMVAYLFAEVARNFQLIHHPEQWIEWVTWSQRGDRSVDIEPDRLPPREVMEQSLDWEGGSAGAGLLDQWLERFGATPFDYQRGLDDASLSVENPPAFDRLEGASFFRGLALIDLAEAMLKRAFGREAVAVRVNAAGQGDYFQVHVDTHRVETDKVKRFLRTAFYRRFGFLPEPEFVELHPGGGAVGVRLNRYDSLSHLVQRLRLAGPGSAG